MDILIPTYNRGEIVVENITLLNRIIGEEGAGETFRILVSNNCSADNTAQLLIAARNESAVEIQVFTQDENIGGENNVLFLLQQASSDYVMFIGDDDFLVPQYLRYVLQTLKREPETRAIIPGIASLYEGGRIVPERNEKFDVREYTRGLAAVSAISYLGHQISGTVFKRSGMAEAFLEDESLGNLYPTIFFLGYSCMRGVTHYAPVYKVLISQDNVKYWNYDESGLLGDIFKNYKILFPSRPIVRLWLCLIVMYRQGPRLGRDGTVKGVIRAFFHLLSSPDLDLLFRLFLPIVFPLLFVRRAFRYCLRRLK